MSKRGRRRSSKRRKSSGSSKQSASQYSFQKQNKSNSVSYKDDIAEKGETDSLRKENVLSGSEEEDKYNNTPPREKRVKRDYHVNSFTNQRSIYTKTTEDAKRGVRTVTSVSVSDVEDSPPKIIVQQSCVLLSGHPPETNIRKMNRSGSHVKVEIQEASQLNASGIKTTFVLLNEKGERADVFVKSRCEKTWSPSNESSEQPSQSVTHNGNQNSNYRFTFGNMSEQTESHSDIVSPPNYSHCCGDHRLIATDFMLTAHPSGTRPLLSIQPQGKRNNFDKSIRSDQFWEIPPPQEFADFKYNNLEDLTHCLASCRIGAQSPADKKQKEFHPTPNITDDEESPWPCSLEAEERADMAPSFHQLSDHASHEPVLMRPSSFTKDFINCRINSIATVEHRARASAKKRHQTYPGMSEGLGLMQEDVLSPCPKSFSSLVMCSLLLQTDKFSAFGGGNYNSSQYQGRSKLASVPQNSRDGKQSLLSSFYMTSSEAMPDDVFTVNEQCRRERSITYHRKGLGQQRVDFKQSICMDVESLENTDQSEVADSGFDQEMGEVEYHIPETLTEELSQRDSGLQVIPPSSAGAEEQILQSHPAPLLLKDQVESQEDPVSVSFTQSESSVMTVTVGAREQRFLQMDSGSSLGVVLEDPCMSPLQEVNSLVFNTSEVKDEIEPKPHGKQAGNASPSLPLMQTNDLQLNTERRTEDSEKPAVTASCPANGSTDAEIHAKEQLTKTDAYTASRSPLEDKEHLKPVVHKDPDSSGSDQWTRRRTLFKESKEWSSAGGSSMISDITEESVSEDARSVDMTAQDNEDRGFYTETFHSSAWIYQGDNVDAAAVPPKTRAVSIRERTVKISRGTGEFPWGFRTQFSKPIVVTEVDTNGAAEEAGLMVGDSVLAVNGTDVTSAAHSEATDLARQGPDVLTLTIGSDIARGPNTPRPACRGYLHKRTQSGLFKGWRKRWFVLTHGCCLFYYRHKRDEGKRRALFAVKLEGAEVGPDVSLGKPFVFKCRPQPGSRVYFLCATSSQEMRRWLGVMEKALHPITQNHVWMDVTRHNSNLPPLAVKTPECLGLLHRYEKVKDTWVQHYCVLKDGCLYLYSGIRATHAYGGIYLQGYVVRELPYGCKKSTIELNPLTDEFKAFYLCAENPNENKRWITAIQASIKKWLPLRSAFQEYMNRPSEETRK